MLKPEEIKNITFEQSVFSGYKKEDVDAFLDKVYDEYSRLYKENAELVGKLKVCIGKIEEYREDEKFLKSAIVNAQKLNETAVQEIEIKKKETEETARKQAEEIILQAKTKAQQMLDESNDKIADFREKTTKEFAQQQQDNARAFEAQMADFGAQIAAKKAELSAVANELEEFRSKILSIFGAEIELINSLPKKELKPVVTQPETIAEESTVEVAVEEVFESPEIVEESVSPVELAEDETIEEQSQTQLSFEEEIVDNEIENSISDEDTIAEEVEEDTVEETAEEQVAFEEDQISIDDVIAQASPVEPAAPIFTMDEEEEEGASGEDEFHLFGNNSPLVFPQDIADEPEEDTKQTDNIDKPAPRFRKKLKFGVDFDVKNDK